MPPRYAYWTILIDNRPTAFRASDSADLLPTLNQLKRTNPNAEMKWFARGKLWDNPEQAQWAARNLPKTAERRGREWRPGGTHKDPRARPGKTQKDPRPAPPGGTHKDFQSARPGGTHKDFRSARPGGTHKDFRPAPPRSAPPGGTHKDLRPARPDRPRGLPPKRPSGAAKGPRRNRG